MAKWGLDAQGARWGQATPIIPLEQTHRRRTRFAVAWALLALALASCAPPAVSASATVAPTASVSIVAPTASAPAAAPTASAPAAAPTPAPTFPQQPSPTPQPSARPQPAFTPTPTPSPTPAGFVSHPAGGFTISHPSGWEIAAQNPAALALLHDEWRLTLEARGQFTPSLTLDQAIHQITAPEQGIFVTSELVSSAPFALPDGFSGQLAFVRGRNALDYGLGLLLLHVEAPPRVYDFFFFGQRSQIEAQRSQLEALLQSIRLQPESIYGAPRSQSLLLLAELPQSQDFDPADAAHPLEGEYLYAGLVRLDESRAGVQPDLAESWQQSPDGLTYTFTLRSELNFASGRPLTAQDVEFSWERAGLVSAGSDLFTLDERTLVWTLAEARPALLLELAQPAGRVVSRAAWGSGVDASGPYTLQQWLPGEALVLRRNERYHQPAAHEYVILRQLPGSALEWLARGEADSAVLTPTEAQIVQSPDHPLHARLANRPTQCIALLLYDASQPPFDNAQVRQAFSQALDRAAIAQALTGSGALAADSLFLPNFPGYIARPVPAADPQTARRALTSLTVDGLPPDVRLAAPGYAGAGVAAVEALAQQWRDAFQSEVSIQYIDPFRFEGAARQSQVQVYFYGWCAEAADGQFLFDPLFRSDSPYNIAAIADPALDARLATALDESNPAQRAGYYGEIERDLLAEFLALPLAYIVEWVIEAP